MAQLVHPGPDLSYAVVLIGVPSRVYLASGEGSDASHTERQAIGGG